MLRTGLRIGEFAYTQGVAYRNRQFDRGGDAVQSVDAPVISVGNLTLGGTGKTPMVKWIARRLREQSWRVAILSRGYGAVEGAKNDEALELEQSLPDVPHLQSPDRVAIARTAIEELESQVLLLDDGFQHRRLARDLDIVLLDATQPFGFDHVFPRGMLREPVQGLARADVVCLSRANLIGPDEREAIRARAAKLAPGASWCEVSHAPAMLLNSLSEEQPLDTLRDARVFGFCGIGNPAAFRQTLESAGANVVGWAELPDHHAYTSDDVARLISEIEKSGAELAICTQKDLVKLRVPELQVIPLWAVVVEIEFLAGEAEMLGHLTSLQVTESPDLDD
ncbi:tetraacyldisaccharide 4'-kinase [Aeoliella mucimassa]|nr:tetraacyldisaccharide 4'-kinase [Aeoliella mucimassa]